MEECTQEYNPTFDTFEGKCNVQVLLHGYIIDSKSKDGYHNPMSIVL